MAKWHPDDLEDKPKRRVKPLGKLVLALAIAGGGTAWLATASPWAPEVQGAWERTPAAAKVAEARAWWDHTPVARALQWVWGLGDSATAIARFAPADTRVYAEIAPSWWTRWWIGDWTKATEGPQGEAIAKLRAYVRDEWALDWDQDLAPWLGTDYGMIGRSSGLEGTSVDEWSVLAEARDHGAADAFLAKLAARSPAGGGGAGYQLVRTKDGQTVAIGRVGGWVIAASSGHAFEALGGHGPSLTTNPRYQRVAGAWPRGAVGHAFFDMGATPRRTDGWPTPEAAGASIAAGNDWATLAWVTAFDTREATPEDRRRWNELLPALDMGRFDQLPASTLLAAGGTATPAFMEALSGPAGAAWTPLGGQPGAGATYAGLLGALRKADGPFALGLTAGDPSSAIAPVGAVLALRPADPDALRADLAAQAQALSGNTDPARLPGKLGEWAAVPWVRGLLPGVMTVVDERHGRTDWKVVKTQGEPLAAWTASGADVTLAGGALAVQACQADRFEALTAGKPFRSVRDRLPARPAFYGFVDGVNAGKLLMASPLIPARFAGQGAQALAALEGMGVALGAGIDAAGFHHAALSVVVAPKP